MIDQRTSHVGFLLIPNFSMLSFTSVIESLRAANTLSGKNLYQWSHISPDGEPAQASNGLRFEVDHKVGTTERFDYVFVCAGGNPSQYRHEATFQWLRKLARQRTRIGGLSGGPYLLARAGVLEGYRFTLHWEHASAFIEEFPDLDLCHSLFEIDRDRLTSSGGSASLDMMHTVIASEHGEALAIAVSDWFLQTHVREGTVAPRMQLRERLGINSAPLLLAVTRMEQTVHAPLKREDLAKITKVSLRQLERLSSKHLGRTLREQYLHIRLHRARDLLRQTSLTVTEVAVACGFASVSHFSRSYSGLFSHSPLKERTSPTHSARDRRV